MARHSDEKDRSYTDGLILGFDDESMQRAHTALKETDDPVEAEYLEALITVIQYHQDPIFDTTDLF
jgi:hypothetical protein